MTPTLHPTNKQPDPSIRIPAGILAAAERANELLKAQVPANEGAAQTEAPIEEVTSEGNVEQGATEDTSHEPKTDGVKTEAAEQKFRSELGRRKRVEEQLRATQDELAQVRRLLAQVQSQLQSQAPPVRTEPGVRIEEPEGLTDEEVQEYGQDFVTVVKKAAREEAARYAKAVAEEVAQVKQQLTGVAGSVQVSAQQTMHDFLTNRVPNWLQLNSDPDFINWVEQVDPFSGQVRLAMLQDAYSRNDASRVAAFFESFLREAAALAPRVPAEPGQGGRASAPTKPTLEQFAAPGKAKPAARHDATSGAQRTFTRAELSKFYSDVAAGRYRGREAEKDRLEAQIFEAQRAGRILN